MDLDRGDTDAPRAEPRKSGGQVFDYGSPRLDSRCEAVGKTMESFSLGGFHHIHMQLPDGRIRHTLTDSLFKLAHSG